MPSSKGASDRSFDGSCCLLITRFLGNAMRCIANAGKRRSRGKRGGGCGGMASRSDWDPVASCHNGADASGCNMRLSCDRRQNITSITAHRAQTTMLPQVRQREREGERQRERSAACDCKCHRRGVSEAAQGAWGTARSCCSARNMKFNATFAA